MKNTAENALKLLRRSESEARKKLTAQDEAHRIVPESVHKFGETLLMILRGEPEELLIVADYRQKLPEGFRGESMELSDGGAALRAPLSHENAVALRRCFPWCAAAAPAAECPVRFVAGALAQQLKEAEKQHCFPVVPLAEYDAAVFGAFRSDCRGRFGVRAAVCSVEEALQAEAQGATLLALQSVAGGSGDAVSECEYAGRTFVLEDGAIVTFSGAEAAEIRCRFADTVAVAAEIARKCKGGLLISFAGSKSTAKEVLFLARELLKRSVPVWGIEPEGIAAGEESVIRQARAAVRAYGNCCLCGAAAGQMDKQCSNGI